MADVLDEAQEKFDNFVASMAIARELGARDDVSKNKYASSLMTCFREYKRFIIYVREHDGFQAVGFDKNKVEPLLRELLTLMNMRLSDIDQILDDHNETTSP